MLTVSGFLYWLLSTETGAQWLIRTAAHQLDGESRDIRGNIWEGLQVGSFEANLPDTSISLSNLALRVDWKALWNSQLHVHELSVDRLSLRLDGESEPDGEPFKMPALPVSIQIDRLALGELNLVQQGEPLPITVADLVGDLTLGDNQGIAHIHHLDVGYEEIHAQAQATVVLDAFEAPWPMSAELQVKAYGTNADSMLCADRYLPGLNVSTPKEVVPSGPASTPASASATPPLETGQGEADFAELEQLIEETNTDEQYCAFSLQTTVQGSLDSLQVALAGEGQGISINGKLNAAPTAAFPLRDTQIAIRLGEDTALEVDLDWAQEIIDGTAFDRVRGSLHSKNINVGALLADESLPAVISADGTYDVLLSEGFTPRTLKLDLDIAEPTSWNQQTLAGHARVDLDLHEVEAGVPFWLGYILNDSDVSLRLGSNLVELKGKLGQSDDQLTINIDAPALAQVSEALSEIGALNAGGTVSGSILRHVVDLNVEYALTPENTGTVGEGKVEAAVQASGEFRPASDSQPAQWKGSVSELVVNHAGIAVAALGPFDLSLALPTPDKGLSLSVAPLRLQTSLDNQNWFVLDHGGSSYDDEGWQTQGSIDPIAIAPARIALLRKKLGMDEVQEQQGGVKDRRTAPAPLADLVIGLDWNLSFKQALAGTLNVKRISGDIMVPAEPAFPLGLNDLFLTVKITPGSGSNSQVNASLVAETQEMGRIEGKVESILRYSADRSFHVLESDIIQANLKADIDDLGWTSLFLGDAMELGGTLDADLNLELRTNGDFTSQGHIRGDNLRLTRLDDGIRLLDGTLEARLDNDVFVLDRLYFPAVLRVEPKEWRTATWVSEDPDAQGGSLTLTGQWNLRESTGQFVADLHRYPILQRADRYAMVTGKLNANIVLPHIALSGKIVADAGWFNLDMLGGSRLSMAILSFYGQEKP
ncbi:hypothetical protein L1889_11695 [Paenalcaligenes niemegkensis]|uniref:translocation/assembly module TamB domain-containing protein n=1 Tax=Paenalcaligenes niemegkensis TaxID=2895469 RepID=UPI001EE7B93F|nr:hypothetical protein [Paenalcaligenes niemegkensis]MCQ9617271.1 hypothetical protein [Paenalcaligenes niemegkensis]